MDYIGILRKSWNVTWRYKILWLFGLFAGGGSSFSYSGNNWNTGSNSRNPVPGNITTAQFGSFVQHYAFLIVVVVLFLIVLGVLLWIVSVAARGGLIHLVNEAEEGREVRVGLGWHAGFAKWWRVFAVGFLADLPAGILAFIMAVIVAIAVVGAIAASGGNSSNVGAAVVTAVTGTCCLLAVFIIAAIAVGLIFGIVKELAFRYAVLEDRPIMESLKAGWRDLWGKRGAFTMYLFMVAVGFVYGIVVGVVALVMIVPAALMMAFGNVFGGGFLIFLGVLVMIVPTAVYATFYHTVWTVFFRAMTGVAPMPKQVAGYPAAPGVPMTAPEAPAPPAPLAPPAPPYVAPEPPVPPAPPAPEPPAPLAPEPPAPEVPPSPDAEPPAGADA
jgi:hypothetical protein